MARIHLGRPRVPFIRYSGVGMGDARTLSKAGNRRLDRTWDDRIERITTGLQLKRAVRAERIEPRRRAFGCWLAASRDLSAHQRLAQLAPHQLEALLAHELAHARRHDYLMNYCRAASQTLFFYHPGVWWVGAENARGRERTVRDDVAAVLCGDPMVYGAGTLETWNNFGGGRTQLAISANGRVFFLTGLNV